MYCKQARTWFTFLCAPLVTHLLHTCAALMQYWYLRDKITRTVLSAHKFTHSICAVNGGVSDRAGVAADQCV